MGICDVCGAQETLLTFLVLGSEDDMVMALCDKCRWEPSLVQTIP